MQNTNTVLVIVLVVLLALLLFGGFGMMGLSGFGMMGPGMMGGMMGGYGYGYNPLGAILSLASWALILGGVLLLAVWLVRSSRPSAATRESALDILKARYARGEITKEQFDAIKRDLGV